MEDETLRTLLQHSRVITRLIEIHFEEAEKKPRAKPIKDFEELCEKIIEYWNDLPGVKKCNKLTDSRRKHIRLCIRNEDGWLTQARQAMDFIRNMFDTGTSPGFFEWKPNFDWFLRTDKTIHILEGQYDGWTLKKDYKAVSGYDGYFDDDVEEAES